MIHIVTDTTAYLPASMLESRNIHTVPLKITVGEETYDEDKISQEEFYTHLDSVEKAPTTSQPAPGEFMALYSSLLQNGDEILSIHISGGLSGTPLVAEMAAQEVAPDRITVIDTHSTSIGLATLVMMADQAIASGGNAAEVTTMVKSLAERQQVFFLVETLDYLAKGGRINGAAKFLGSMLHLRPLLYLDKGKIEGYGVARTRKRGILKMLDTLDEAVGSQLIYAGITHIQCGEEAEKLAATVRERFNCTEVLINEIGPVIGSHVGPGVLGIAVTPIES